MSRGSETVSFPPPRESQMKVSFIEPRSELRPHVESLWIFESSVGLPQAEACLAAPNGCPKLTFPYGNSVSWVCDNKTLIRPAGILNFAGNRDNSILLHSSAHKVGCIGVEFYPHGAFPIFGQHMGDSLNFLGDAESVLGKWAAAIQEELAAVESPEQRVALLQQHLAFRLRRNQTSAFWQTLGRNGDLIAHCVRLLKSSDGLMSVADLERSTGYTRRYLDLLFKRHVGLAPKVLAGILRFQKFYRLWASGQSFDLIKTALYEDYFDQSHFTREFKKITGHAPSEFFERGFSEFGQRFFQR